MIVPVGDVNRRKSVPYLSGLLILLNIGVHVYLMTQPEPEALETVKSHALWPVHWRSADGGEIGQDVPRLDLRAKLLTLVTSMFLHGDLLHLLGNMFFLLTVGPSLEDRMGRAAFLATYLVTGLAGSVAHIVMALGPLSSMAEIPTIGASGAISGLMGAYLVLFPASRIRFMIILILFYPTFVLPSWGAIGLWVASQVIMARDQLFGDGKDEMAMVAVFAHLGGFAAGFLLTLSLRLSGKFKPRRSPES